MTEAEKPKNLETVEASSSSMEPPDNDDHDTPALAVWVSLGLIILAGLYGLYLGTSKKHQPSVDVKETSSLDVLHDRRLS